MSFLLLTLQLSWTEKEDYVKHSQLLMTSLTRPCSFSVCVWGNMYGLYCILLEL